HTTAWELADNPAPAVKLLARKLAPLVTTVGKMRTLVEELDADDFDTRQEAEKRLRALGTVARTWLLRANDDASSLEVKMRLARVLAEAKDTQEARRAERAVMALERMGTPEAKALLKKLGR